MDEAKKSEIMKKIKKQQYIKAHAEATIIKLQAQIESEITRTSRNKPKMTKSDVKVTKDDIKVTKTTQKNADDQNNNKGFFDSVFG